MNTLAWIMPVAYLPRSYLHFLTNLRLPFPLRTAFAPIRPRGIGTLCVTVLRLYGHRARVYDALNCAGNTRWLRLPGYAAHAHTPCYYVPLPSPVLLFQQLFARYCTLPNLSTPARLVPGPYPAPTTAFTRWLCRDVF